MSDQLIDLHNLRIDLCEAYALLVQVSTLATMPRIDSARINLAIALLESGIDNLTTEGN